MTKKFSCRLLLVVLGVNLTGCGSTSSAESLGNGYEEVTYTQNSISEPSAHRISLQFQNLGGKQTIIWPSLDGVREVIHDDVVIFVGKAAFKHLDPGEPNATRSRLFAVKALELPLDITDEVLWRWSKQSGDDFAKTLATASIVYPKEMDNAVEFHFVTWPPSHHDIILKLDWNQIAEVMREVKEKGVVHKDSRWGTSYIEKEFKPEVQK